MNRIVTAAAIVILGLNSFACSDPESDPSNRLAPEPVSKATNEATPRSVMKPDPLPELASSDESLVVPATANIFAAGRNSNQLMAAAPGGGGAGTLPPGWRIRPGSKRIVTFPSVTGRINFLDRDRRLERTFRGQGPRYGCGVVSRDLRARPPSEREFSGRRLSYQGESPLNPAPRDSTTQSQCRVM